VYIVVSIQDTPTAPKPKPTTSKPKLKGAQSLTPPEKEAANIMQSLNESKKTSKRFPENVILKWGSEQESEYSKEDQLDNEEKDDKEGHVDDEGDDHISNTKVADDEDDETESDEDEIYEYKIHVRKDEDEDMLNAEAEDSRKDDA
nr:hypothetical protein [Tanacetum cinerariifolium]